MKSLIIGASGQVGGALKYKLKDDSEVAGTYTANEKEGLIRLDITKKEGLDQVIKEFDSIILCSAAANVDYCETHMEEAQRLNVDGARNVAESCSRLGKKLVFMSTDYVFDGASGPYSEDATTNPINVYGKTKLEGEKIVSQVEGSLILRITNVFNWGFDKRNFFYFVYTNLKAGKPVKGITDQYATPCFSGNLADFIIELINENKSGVYNIGLDEYLTRYDFATRIADFFNLDRSLIGKVTTAELKQIAPRPKFAGFDLSKIKRECKTKTIKLEEAFEDIKRRL